MKTRPRGIHATFSTDCLCGSEITITNGRPDPHDCRPRTSPEWLAAMNDYYTAGADGAPPKHPRDDR